MKPIYTAFLIAFLSINTFAQGSNWVWAHNAGGTFNSSASSVANDNSGNVIITGGFASPTITFGNITLTNADNSGNTSDIFIVKYDALGTVLWAKSVVGGSHDVATSICADTNGNVFVTGYFDSPTIAFGTTTLTNSSGADIFIVKYNPSGNALWAKSSSGNFLDIGYGIASDNNGSVIITGSFDSPTISFGTITLTNTGISNIFIVKYDALGNILWAKSAGGNSSDEGYSVSTDASGNVLVAGRMNSPSITFGATTLMNSGSQGIFVVKYDASGNVLWAKTAVGEFENSMSISTDANGNGFVVGSFTSDSVTFGTTTLNTTGIRKFFIVKYNPSGNVLWAKSIGGVDYDEAYSVSTDSGGNAFVTGSFSSPTITFDTITLTNTSTLDIFIVKYDPSGNALWAEAVGGNYNDIAFGVSNNANGNVFITGAFNSTSIAFGTTTITNTDSTGNIYNIFIAKLNGGTLGITELEKILSFTLAPNPFTASTSILFAEEQRNITIILTDVLGKQIKTINFTGRQYVLEKENMKEGIYFLQVIDEMQHIRNRKIVIQ